MTFYDVRIKFLNHRCEQELLGVFNSIIKQKIPTHGILALIIKKKTNVPQFLATSRHLTAAQSIQQLKWEVESNTLIGESKTVQGDIYSVFIHVPENFKFQTFEVNAENVSHKLDANNILEVSFTGTSEPIEWQIKFD